MSPVGSAVVKIYQKLFFGLINKICFTDYIQTGVGVGDCADINIQGPRLIKSVQFISCPISMWIPGSRGRESITWSRDNMCHFYKERTHYNLLHNPNIIREAETRRDGCENLLSTTTSPQLSWLIQLLRQLWSKNQ